MGNEATSAAKRIFLDPKRPLESARLFLSSLRTPEDEDVIRYHCEDFFVWGGACYRQVEDEVIRRMLYRWAEECWTKGADGGADIPFAPNKPKIDHIMDTVRAEALVESILAMPAWLDGRRVDARECIACRNGIVHLPTLVDRGEKFLEPPTPLYFSTCALPFEFAEQRPEPKAWIQFLDEIFDDDDEAVELLQEWIGYLLTADTRQQKMLLVYGPKRAGKGTIARIITALVGPQNVANPTLSGLATNFGLWPLVNKSLAIVGDARLSGRSDQSAVVERLLSISGEDSLTIDRKNREPVTLRLPTRVMLLTNELPKLTDASGALANRFLILRLKKSFLGEEDMGLEQRLLAELPAILLWAIDGWKRLRDRGRFSMPATSTAAIRELDELGSPVTAFARECLSFQPGARTECKTLYKTWCDWCTAQGRERPGSQQSFSRDFGAAFPAVDVVQHRLGGIRVRSYEGVLLGGGEE